jgi:hypothetical protein
MAGGYWQDGRFIQGATVRTAGTFSVGQLGLQVAAAVARARVNSNALGELAELLRQYPQLRVEAPQPSWNSGTKEYDGELHLLTPLAQLYAEQLFNSTA